MKTEKLVRDNYPEIISTKGEIPEFYVENDDDKYLQKLNEKLFEELNEVCHAEKKRKNNRRTRGFKRSYFSNCRI